MSESLLGSPALIPAARRHAVLEFIERQGSVQVRELVKHIGVSEATIRRDLDELASKGLITRTHGGAIGRSPSTSFETLYDEKRQAFAAEKKRMAQAGAKYVRDGETLILDSGSTTLELAWSLTGHKNLTIISNDLHIATAVAFDPSTTVLVPGGLRREGFNVLVGTLTENFFRNVRVDKSFLAADAVDIEFGVSNANFAECAIKQLIIAAGKEVILVADHSKFQTQALAKVCPISAIDLILSDTGLDPEVADMIRHANIQLELC